MRQRGAAVPLVERGERRGHVLQQAGAGLDVVGHPLDLPADALGHVHRGVVGQSGLANAPPPARATRGRHAARRCVGASLGAFDPGRLTWASAGPRAVGTLPPLAAPVAAFAVRAGTRIAVAAAVLIVARLHLVPRVWSAVRRAAPDGTARRQDGSRGDLLSQWVAPSVPSALEGLTSGFGM